MTPRRGRRRPGRDSASPHRGSVARRIIAAWIGLYTRGIEPLEAEDRRRELESDVWEHLASHRALGRSSRALLLRAALGAPADLRWRSAHRSSHGRKSTSARPVRRHPLNRTPPPLKPWVPLGEPHLFDQTNGVVDVTGRDRIEADPDSPSLFGMNVVANIGAAT